MNENGARPQVPAPLMAGQEVPNVYGRAGRLRWMIHDLAAGMRPAPERWQVLTSKQYDRYLMLCEAMHPALALRSVVGDA